MRRTVIGKAGSAVLALAAMGAIAGSDAWAQGDGLTGNYYYGASAWTGTPYPPPPPPGSPEANAATWTASTTRVDATINFVDGSATAWAPASSNVVVTWTGYILTGADSGSYTFYITTDDGSRLWVTSPMAAGGEIINSWQGQGPTPYTGNVPLLPHTFYPVRYEYFQGGGGSSATLGWSSASMPQAIIPTANLFSANNASVCKPPSGLTATGGFDQAVLNWTAGSGQTSYTVLRGTATGGPYTVIATGVTGTTYTDTTAANPGPYFYVVFGVNSFGNSPYSNEANCTTKQPVVSVSPGSLQVAENGGTATFTVTLRLNPTANVTVQCTSAAPGSLLLTAPGGTAMGTINLVFTPGGALSQQVLVTGVEQHLQGAPIVVNVTFTVSSTDPNYPANSAPAACPVTIIQDLPAIIVNPPSGLATVNGGPAITFTVQLATSNPAGTVILNLSVTDPNIATVSPPLITTAAWNNPVTVTVTPNNVNTQTTYIAPYDIIIDSTASGDPGYAAIGQTLVPIDTPVNLPPLQKVWGGGGGGCGLLGLEGLLPLLLAAGWRRRRSG
jgi:hypothetical protein